MLVHSPHSTRFRTLGICILNCSPSWCWPSRKWELSGWCIDWGLSGCTSPNIQLRAFVVSSELQRLLMFTNSEMGVVKILHRSESIRTSSPKYTLSGFRCIILAATSCHWPTREWEKLGLCIDWKVSGCSLPNIRFQALGYSLSCSASWGRPGFWDYEMAKMAMDSSVSWLPRACCAACHLPALLHVMAISAATATPSVNGGCLNVRVQI